MRKGFNLSYYDRHYQSLVKEEISEWKKIEKKAFEEGIPLWTDLRRAKAKGRNLSWRDDPVKDKIVRGEEKELMIKLASQKKGKVLDLGCGSGWLCLELARRGMEVVGIDVSPDRIKIAKKFLRENPYKKNFGSVKYVVGDLNKDKLPKEKFDVVVVWNTFHHFPRLGKVLKKVKLSLKPGGRLIVFDHIGNRFLKMGTKALRLFSQKARKEKIIPYEDFLGKKMIDVIGKQFSVKLFKSRLSFPISVLLFCFFNQDKLVRFLPFLVKIDKILCNSRLFLGEYIFIEAVKEDS